MTSYLNDTADLEARKTLNRYKRAATGLLVLMAGLTVAGYAIPASGLVQDSFCLEILRAGARAGVVGGLADWFAVVALFRRPLGLPIPHTAILPAQKERLGRALGRFVSRQVFTEQEVQRVLDKLNIGSFLSKTLDDPATQKMVVRILSSSLRQALDRLEDGRAAEGLSRLLSGLVGGSNFTPVVARMLRSLVDNDRHQEVLSYLLEQVKEGLQSREGVLRTMIEDRVREQGGRLLGWAIGGSIATKVLFAVSKELDRVDPQNSDLREGFTAWARHQIDRIEQDSERSQEISGAITAILSHESVVVWWSDLWRRFRSMVESDADNPDGRIASVLQDALNRLARQLDQDQKLQQEVEEKFHKLLIKALPSARQQIEEFISQVVASWDGVQVAEKLELRVGKDLQFIRFNGTLVGFGAGALLFIVLRELFGLNVQ